MNLSELPHNVLHLIAINLNIPEKINLAQTCKSLFENIIPLAYSTIIFDNYGYNARVTKSRLLKGYDEVEGRVTIITPANISKFFKTLHSLSVANICYADFVIDLYLEELTDLSIFDLALWRNNLPENAFPNLKRYQFATNYPIKPLTYIESPNLDTVVLDTNFSAMVDENYGSVSFVDFAKIQNIFFKGHIGTNEDMVIFKMITSFPHTINNLCEIHFLVDDSENYNMVYRRLVGFFAILRKMKLPMKNINSLTIPITNQSSSTIIGLLGKHIIFENLNSLTLLFEDDGDVLNMIKSTDQLSSVVSLHGLNIEKLSIKYTLLKEDEEKNHLRAMMLLKLCESFHKLTHLKIEVNINGLNLSNLLMILGTPISNNMGTLMHIRISVDLPSENLISNILPTLEDATMIFPKLNFIDSCSCDICQTIYKKLQIMNQEKLDSRPHGLFGFGNFFTRNDTLNDISPELFLQSIRVGTLLIIGQELDDLQASGSDKFSSKSIVNRYKSNGWFRRNVYSSNGYLFDHLIRGQLNMLLPVMPHLKTFDICGAVYVGVSQSGQLDDDGDFDIDGNKDNGHSEFVLRYGNEFKGLDEDSLINVVELGNVFTSGFRR
ncbi:hypothetical protein DAMA08_030970 [Martiniozyma asiatica (nom. inval.)]|nr:hypothetical protein DAMA08_030970 [Martiniozyma asiatica]